MNTPQSRNFSSAVTTYRLPLIALPDMRLVAAAWMCFGLIVAAGQATAQDQQPAGPAASIAVEVVQAEIGQAAVDVGQAAVDVEQADDEKAEAAREPVDVALDAAGNSGEAVVAADEHDPQVKKLRRYVRVNCALARRACELSDSEEAAFAQMDDAWIAKQIRESIELPGVGEMVGILRFLGGAARDVRPQEVKIPAVKKRIDSAIDEALSPEHRETFQRERDERVNFRKQALAGVLVAVLDESLFLSPEQRSLLEPAVAAWLTTDLYWEFYFQNSNYLPDIPRQVLAQALSPTQLAVVQEAQKYNYERAQFEEQTDPEPVMIKR